LRSIVLTAYFFKTLILGPLPDRGIDPAGITPTCTRPARSAVGVVTLTSNLPLQIKVPTEKPGTVADYPKSVA
jgi:hypothetical protein